MRHTFSSGRTYNRSHDSLCAVLALRVSRCHTLLRFSAWCLSAAVMSVAPSDTGTGRVLLHAPGEEAPDKARVGISIWMKKSCAPPQDRLAQGLDTLQRQSKDVKMERKEE